jgi:hypothetical protein
MTLIPCPECAREISDDAYSCPHCGKPMRQQPVQFGYGYEYRSAETLFGWPMIHIATGIDPSTGRKRVARGVIAIGDVALGGVALGGLAVGGLALGGCALGLVTLGGLSVALLLAIGGGAISTGVAVGGAAIGYYALGGGAFGPHALGGNGQDPEAIEFFSEWLGDWIRQIPRRRW